MIRSLRTVVVLFGAIGAAMMSTLTACGPRVEPMEPLGAPLTYDPEDAAELTEWWTNGTALVRLGVDAAFELYSAGNQYRAPDQRGRWSQKNYAALIIEPYARWDNEPRRVAVGRDDIGPHLEFPDLGTFRPLSRPPVQTEDGLIGQWDGPGGALTLDANGGYALSPTKTAPGHRGAWQLMDADSILLTPGPDHFEPFILSITDRDDAVVLAGANGELARVRIAPLKP